ncbi:Recombination-promoting nuclease RpnE [Candidatus Magnetaquicoccaceae bacterium FCR-1]|uniref:Recombination-promoting nuclease RpnE n=1 Tax=Candidatus Magnetaquiglobus chichijimensis TaxID=3141448 RepID=A0ABQ0CAJ3_9PROT
MSDLFQPHDRLFKALVSNPETAGALLREYLPQEIVALLAPGDPELEPGSFVSQELQPYYSDRLFRSTTLSGRNLFFYTLMEHKSYPDRKVAWQLFLGCSRFWEQQNQKNPEWTLLPAIVPFVLYHGAQEWKIPKEFHALIDADDALRPWLVNFPFTVTDLGPIPDSQLARNARLKACLLALKYGTRSPEEQMTALESIAAALMEAPELLIPIMLYLFTTFPHLDQSVVQDVVVRVCPQENVEMMSIFAREIIEQHKHTWLQDGEQRGRQEGFLDGEKKGRQEEAASMLLKLMRRKFGQTPDWVTEKVRSADLELLGVWSENVLFANSVDEVFIDRH